MKTVAALSAIIALANAHATWQQLWKNGEDLESTCARLPPSNSPIEDYTSTALQCNVNPAAAAGKCSYAAGDTVTIEMHQHNDRECTKEGIGGAHWGPVLAYLGKVEDAATADGSGEFFKVYQNGWKKNPAASQGDNDFWGTKDLNYNCGKLDFKIPSDIAPGDYLLRAEAIALHAASTGGGAQHYVTCYQLTVTGSGTLVPKGVKFPEAYSKTGPGLGFSIHANLDSYPVPGPELIASGTDAAPQLLTFGQITGTPAAGTGESKPAASSAAAAPASSSAAVVAPASSAVVEPVSSPVAEAVTTPAAPVVSEVPASSTYVAEPEVSSEVAPLPAISSAPYPAGNSSVVLPTGTGAPVEPTAVPTLSPPVISKVYSTYSVALPTTLATIVRPKPSQGASTGPIKEWYQCGGQGFKGASTCAEGLECKEWNPWYSQCVKPEATKPGPSKGPMPSAAPAKPTKPAGSKPSAAPAPAKPTTPAGSKPSAAPAPVKPTPVEPGTAPSPTAPAEAEPTIVAPVDNEPTEKLFTLETFIAWLEENAGSDSAAKIRRMIEALQ
ncbi:glycosyl hydrolase family 61-domain-containing protein [Paraphoma chrysanthemicola]|nr:glycosyl hydrolase family 61-domain-containing protein [Paraphoma chrysanthemicola]